MTPPAPTPHTFDPQIAGFIGVYIDPPASYDQVIWYSSHVSTGPWVEIDVSWPSTAISADGLALVIHAGSTAATVYLQCKLHDATGYGALCAPVAAIVSSGPPAPPPPPTAQQDLATALGVTINPGDQVALYPSPSVVKTVQSDGSVS
jgi:hypothetical protein